jgi:hypothetical protein
MDVKIVGQATIMDAHVLIPLTFNSESEEMLIHMGWDLAEWSERCTSISKIAGSNPSGGSE